MKARHRTESRVSTSTKTSTTSPCGLSTWSLVRLLASLQSIQIELACSCTVRLHALVELVLLQLAIADGSGRGRSALMAMNNLRLTRAHHSIHGTVRNAHADTGCHSGHHGTHQTRHHAFKTMCPIGAYMCHGESSGLVRDLRSKAKPGHRHTLGTPRASDVCLCPRFALDRMSRTSPDDLYDTYKRR